MKSVRPGDVLAGKYRVERVLGQGGMGYVVAARHLQLDQLVAMKFLRHGGLEEREATARFLREAKAAVKLQSEHVARVFDVGTLETGEPYMVMEYLDGSDLSALSKQRGQVPVGEAVDYLLQASEALAEAHSLGIIHRDVKLANLFVARGPGGAPVVKVLDFGVSKTNPFGESDHEITRTSSVLGSPRFMSPEQMRDARAVDARTDIWALGVVLFRLVGGKAPFEAETLGQLLSMVMHERPTALSSMRADLPPGFERVVLRCLEKDPNARWANVAELAYALAVYASDPVRARGAADKVAATLSVAQAPPPAPSASQVSSIARRPSGPPGTVDTGTAAWGGTRGGFAPVRSSLMWAGAALVGLGLVGGVFLAKAHKAPTISAAAPTKAPALAADVTAQRPVPVMAAPATPAAVVTVPDAAPAKPKTAADEPKKRPMTVAPPPRRPFRSAQVPAPGPKEEGIPSTRD